MARALASKLIGEALNISFDFRDVLPFGATISSADITVGVASGIDYAPADMISGAVSISGGVVTQKITGGMAGVVYALTCTATGSTGTIHTKVRTLAVLPQDANLPILTGMLPDGTAGLAYSETLLVSGGYPPYTAAGVASGTAPSWMQFSLSENILTCYGTPDELSANLPANYVFSPQIQDSTGATAVAAQDINITTVTISGDLPDGVVGESGTYQYTISGGVTPYASVSIPTGALPTVSSIDGDGLVSYAYDTAGSNLWQVEVIDAAGYSAIVNDSNNITAPVQELGHVYQLLAHSATTDVTIAASSVWVARSTNAFDTFTEVAITNGPSMDLVRADGIGLFIGANGSGNIVTSVDGLNPWTTRSVHFSGATDVRLAYSPTLNIVVAHGDTGTDNPIYSADGINWTECTISGLFPTDGLSITWNADIVRFLLTNDSSAGTNQGSIWESADGITFTKITDATTSASSTNAIHEYGNYLFFNSAASQYYITSPDGISFADSSAFLPRDAAISAATTRHLAVIGSDVYIPRRSGGNEVSFWILQDPDTYTVYHDTNFNDRFWGDDVYVLSRNRLISLREGYFSTCFIILTTPP